MSANSVSPPPASELSRTYSSEAGGIGITAHVCVPRVSSRVAGLRGGASLENLVAAPGVIESMNVQFAESTSECLVRLWVELMVGQHAEHPVGRARSISRNRRSDTSFRSAPEISASMCGASGRRERVEKVPLRGARTVVGVLALLSAQPETRVSAARGSSAPAGQRYAFVQAPGMISAGPPCKRPQSAIAMPAVRPNAEGESECPASHPSLILQATGAPICA